MHESTTPSSIKRNRPWNGERYVLQRPSSSVDVDSLSPRLVWDDDVGCLHSELVPLHRRRRSTQTNTVRRRVAHSSASRVGVLAMDDCDVDPRKGRSRVMLPLVLSRQATMPARPPRTYGGDDVCPARSADISVAVLTHRPSLTATVALRSVDVSPVPVDEYGNRPSPPATFVTSSKRRLKSQEPRASVTE